jgi:hypothetical protein
MESMNKSAMFLALLAAAGCSGVQIERAPTPPAQSVPAAATASSGRRSTAASLGIPPGHLPPVGQCRVWMPGQPPGHQARARSCDNVERAAPAGSWILYRPTEDRKIVQVRVVDGRRAGVIVHRRTYDVQRGTLLRES